MTQPNLTRGDDYNDESRWTKMPIAELTTPAVGRICYGPSWWAVTDDECVLFFRPGKVQRYASPQCNDNRQIIERIRKGLQVRFIEMAFIPHRCEDYV